MQSTEQHNLDYNTLLRSIAGDIFVSESEFPRYVPGRAQVVDLLAPLPADQPPPYEIIREPLLRDPLATAEYNLDKVGDYERLVFSCVAWGRYHVYCVLGEMGSGKTAMLKHLESILLRPKKRLCLHCKTLTRCESLIVRVDLNGFDTDNPVALANALRKRLYAHTSKKVREFLIDHNYVNEFITGVRKAPAGSIYALFDDLIRQVESDTEWRKLSRRQKGNRVMQYIADQPDTAEKLEMALVALRFIVENVRKERACAVLMIDNIDKFNPECQMAALKQTLSLQKYINIKTLVALRPTNFSRLHTEATMAFGVIVHSGASPTDVVIQRIEYFLEHPDSEPLLQQLTARARSGILARLRHVLLLLNQGGPFADTLASLSGNSSRLALTLMERVLVNSVYRYDDERPNQNDLVRALLVGDNPDVMMNRLDKNVANVFTDGQTNGLSTICLRILGLLYVLRGQRELTYPSVIIRTASLATGQKPEEVLEALRYLMYSRRPLIWAEGKTDFENRPKTLRDLSKSREALTLTIAGSRYFRNLTMAISYVQEALQCVSLDAGYDRAAQFDISGRFSLLRDALRRLLEIDEKEFVRYEKGRHKISSSLPTPALVASRIIYGVGRSALRILEADRGNRGDAAYASGEEIKEWLNFLLVTNETEERLMGKTNTRIDALVQTYDIATGERKNAASQGAAGTEH